MALLSLPCRLTTDAVLSASHNERTERAGCVYKQSAMEKVRKSGQLQDFSVSHALIFTS